MISKKPLFMWLLERCQGLQVFLILMILTTVFFRVVPLELQKRIVNTAIPLKEVNALFIYCGLYILAVVLSGGMKLAINVLQGYIGQKVLLDMRLALYDHTLKLPLNFFRRTPAGTVIASLTSELGAVGEFIGGAIAVPTINVLTLVTFAAYMTYLNPLLAFLSFIIYPAEIIIIPLLQRRFNLLNQKRINMTRSLSNIVGEAISGMHEIHGNAAYGLEHEKLAGVAGRLFSVRHRMNIFKYLIKFTNNFFQSLGPFSLFLVGGYLTIKGQLDLGALVAFLSAYEKLYDPWKELMDYYQELQDSRVRYHQVMSYFDDKPEFDISPSEDRDAYSLDGNISVRDVSFTVDGRTQVLDGVTLDIRSGEQLALVGPSGSGKSSLAMIMGQLYQYTKGQVLLDEKELKTLTKLDISRNIGYVPQYPYLFDGSILDNILYAYRSAHPDSNSDGEPPSQKQILGVIDSVGLSEDILHTALNSSLHRERHRHLALELVRIRKLFAEDWRIPLEGLADFIDPGKFQYFNSIAENIIFGYPAKKEYEPDELYKNRKFLAYLASERLTPPLIDLGIELATQTTSLLEGLQDNAFFFEMSPIHSDEFDSYAEIVDRLRKAFGGSLREKDEISLLRVALRFIPAQHKMASLAPSLESRILSGRQSFMRMLAATDPGGVIFYSPSEYIFTQSILKNVLFGDVRSEHLHAVELIKKNIVDLLSEQGLLDEVMGVGLEFAVGSKGDRLSGGQKQKIAIARALLKNPPILILDEATASLDNTSQARIQHLLNSDLKGGCTIVSVMHRLEMAKDYDQIAVMRAGRIVELGRYEELMERRGLFYELAHGLG